MAIFINDRYVLSTDDMLDRKSFHRTLDNLAASLHITKPMPIELGDTPYTNWADVLTEANRDKTPVIEHIRVHATNVSELTPLCEHFDFEEVFNHNNTFEKISDKDFHDAKDAYLSARDTLTNYVFDTNNHDTPLCPIREEKHGWNGYATVKDVTCVIGNEGFIYGLLHKSCFSGVNDAQFHALNNTFAHAYYALCKVIGYACVTSNIKPFDPMIKSDT
jgi:hypothetical protein